MAKKPKATKNTLKRVEIACWFIDSRSLAESR
jgi:hypothetical protein